LPELFGPPKSIAAGNKDFHRRVNAQGLPDKLPALPVSFTGNGTAVDKDSAGLFDRLGRRITPFLEFFGKYLAFVLIDLAAEGMDV
jgi:hypothetical protein